MQPVLSSEQLESDASIDARKCGQLQFSVAKLRRDMFKTLLFAAATLGSPVAAANQQTPEGQLQRALQGVSLEYQPDASASRM